MRHLCRRRVADAAVPGSAAHSSYRIRSRHYAARPLMVCRSDVGELRQILRIGDIGRDICLSAFEALPCIRLAARTQQATALSSSSSKQTTRHTKYAPRRGLAKFIRQRRRKRDACCSRAGSLVGGVAVRERDRETRSACGLKREYHVRASHGKEQAPGPVHKLAVRAENASNRIFKAPGIRRMHLGSADGIGLGRNFVPGLNVILQYGAELSLFFSAGSTVCRGRSSCRAGAGMEPQLANEPGRIRERLTVHLELNRRIRAGEITAFNPLSVLQNQRIADGHAARQREQEGQARIVHRFLKNVLKQNGSCKPARNPYSCAYAGNCMEPPRGSSNSYKRGTAV